MKIALVVSLLISSYVATTDGSMIEPNFPSLEEGLHITQSDVPPVTVGACVYDHHDGRKKCADYMTRDDCAQMERDMHGVTTVWYHDKECTDVKYN